MARNDEQVMDDLNNIYAPMHGMGFSGEFLETAPMPTTGKRRDIIEVTDDTMEGILAGIWESISAKPYGPLVWKGITGPKDSPVYNNYRL